MTHRVVLFPRFGHFLRLGSLISPTTTPPEGQVFHEYLVDMREETTPVNAASSENMGEPDRCALLAQSLSQVPILTLAVKTRILVTSLLASLPMYISSSP